MPKIHFFQNILLVMSIALSLLSFYYPPAMHLMIFDIHKLRKREWYRLLLSGFIHADYVHLLFNMFTYYAFAYTWAAIYNTYFELPWWVFGYFYISAIVVVNISVWLVNRKKQSYTSLGASGGVSALVFACILVSPWERLYVFFIPMPAIVFALLYVGYSTYRSMYQSHKDNINHFAHLVGSLYGILFSICIEPNVLSIFIQELIIRGM